MVPYKTSNFKNMNASIISSLKSGYAVSNGSFEYRYEYDDNGETVVVKTNLSTGTENIITVDEFKSLSFDTYEIIDIFGFAA